MRVKIGLAIAQIAEGFRERNYRVAYKTDNYILAYMPGDNIQIEYDTRKEKLDVSCVLDKVDMKDPTQQTQEVLQQINQMAILQELLALPGIQLLQQPAYANGYLVAAIEVES